MTIDQLVVAETISAVTLEDHLLDDLDLTSVPSVIEQGIGLKTVQMSDVVVVVAAVVACAGEVDQEAGPMIVDREGPGLAQHRKAYEFRKSRNLIFYISICVAKV
jgi:hypothetical protein